MDLGPLEADFATLDAQLARIAETRFSLGGPVAAILDQMVAEAEASASGPDADVGHRVQKALTTLLRQGAATDLHGNLGFDVDKEALLVHGAPVVQEVVGVVQEQVQSFVDELTRGVAAGVAGAAKEAAPEEGKKGPKLKVDLGSLFAGLIQGAMQQAKKPKE